ncbi:hypothetical protein CR513_18912, partial [Mucuna pruriens]
MFPVFQSETESIRLYRICQHLVKTVSDKFLARPYRTSLYREQLVFQPRVIYLMRIETSKNALITLAPLPGTQVLLFFVCQTSTNSFAEQMENNERTLKELATPDVVYQPWCIQYPQLEPAQTYELKYGLIHLLPKCHGLAGEDPHKHLKEFHVVCSTMRS